jgi:hypothetical protein
MALMISLYLRTNFATPNTLPAQDPFPCNVGVRYMEDIISSYIVSAQARCGFDWGSKGPPGQ